MPHRIAWGRVGVACLVLVLAAGRWSSTLRAQQAAEAVQVQPLSGTEERNAEELPSDPTATTTAAPSETILPARNGEATNPPARYESSRESAREEVRPRLPQAGPPPVLSTDRITPPASPYRITPPASPYREAPAAGSQALPAGIPVRPVQKAHVVVESHLEPFSPEALARFQRQAQLNEAIRRAETDAARQELAAELKQLVAATFDEDFAAREGELVKLEERVQALRAKQEQRKSNRERIIQLHVDSVLLDAEGLTVPGMRVPLSAYGSENPLNGVTPAYGTPPPIYSVPRIPATNPPLRYTDPTTGETYQFGTPPTSSY